MRRATWLFTVAFSLPAWAVRQEPVDALKTGAEAHLQVWLQTQANATGLTKVLPYARARQTLQLHASVTVVKKGAAGSARATQQASVQALAGEAALLGHFALDLKPEDECHMDIVLNDQLTSAELGRYRLSCQP